MMTSTVLEILQATESYFEQRGVDAPRLSAELIVGRVLGLGRLKLYLAHDRPVDEPEKARLRPLVARRGAHEPVQYVLGDTDFRGHVLEVTPAVLIPRPETEGLVELALGVELPDGARVVDLGTGSGAIAVAIAVERPTWTVTAVDASEDALEVARRNVERCGVAERVQLVHGSWWEPLAAAAPFDLLISNPPYVDPARPELVAEDVQRYEPSEALFTPAGEPAAPYVTIAAGVGARMRSGATLLFETGVGAAEPSRDALRRSDDIVEVELLPDLAGIDRYLRARVAAAGPNSVG